MTWPPAADAVTWELVALRCTATEAAVLRLRVQRGHSWRRIGQELDLAPTTVRDTYDRAMRHLGEK